MEGSGMERERARKRLTDFQNAKTFGLSQPGNWNFYKLFRQEEQEEILQFSEGGGGEGALALSGERCSHQQKVRCFLANIIWEVFPPSMLNFSSI